MHLVGSIEIPQYFRKILFDKPEQHYKAVFIRKLYFIYIIFIILIYCLFQRLLY